MILQLNTITTRIYNIRILEVEPGSEVGLLFGGGGRRIEQSLEDTIRG